MCNRMCFTASCRHVTGAGGVEQHNNNRSPWCRQGAVRAATARFTASVRCVPAADSAAPVTEAHGARQRRPL